MWVAWAKAFRIFFLAYFLSEGVDLLLEPYANYGVTASSLEVGAIAAGCIVLHDLTTSLGTFHDIMRETIIGLAAVVVLINTFITIPLRLPTLLVIVIALVATLADLLLSMVIRYGLPRITSYLKRHGIF